MPAPVGITRDHRACREDVRDHLGLTGPQLGVPEQRERAREDLAAAAVVLSEAWSGNIAGTIHHPYDIACYRESWPIFGRPRAYRQLATVSVGTTQNVIPCPGVRLLDVHRERRRALARVDLELHAGFVELR